VNVRLTLGADGGLEMERHPDPPVPAELEPWASQAADLTAGRRLLG
jgi:hypothetical protein